MRDELAQTFVEEQQLSNEDMKLLSLIWSTEPMTFFDLCNALRQEGLCPMKGDKSAWGDLFKRLGLLRQLNYIDYRKNPKTNSIENLQLSEEGANVVRDYADKHRELFQSIDEDVQEKEYYGISQYE